MAFFNDTVKVATANNRTNKFQLSCDHVTTQEFFDMRPTYSRMLIPGQSISIRESHFIRLVPLFKPAYSYCKVVTRGFFVPMRTIFPFFNDFITDTTSIYQGTTRKFDNVPYTTNNNLRDMFLTVANGFVTQISDPDANGVYDIKMSASEIYNFTRKGRRAQTILNSLGITVNFLRQETTDIPISLMRVLAFAKIICDWYTNSQYTTREHRIEAIISSITASVASPAASSQLATLFDSLVYSLYDLDYFTACFDNPQVPTQGTVSSVNIPEIKDYSKFVNEGGAVTNRSSLTGDSRVNFDSSDNQTPPPFIEGKTAFGGSTDTTSSSIQGRFVYRGIVTMLNQYMVDSLKALTDFIKRYQLVGTRTIDRYKAQFGIELEAAKLNRSVYLGKSEDVIQISDVTATAATEDSVLGNYAAKGIAASQDNKFEYKADEFGFVLLITTILPRTGYSQGINRGNLCIDRLDFYQGDFDNLGTEAIAKGELYNDFTDNTFGVVVRDNFLPTGVFGYIQRYAWAKVANDWLSGDFRCKSLRNELDRWHTFRMFDPDSESDLQAMARHSEDFCVGDADQYNRIFNYDGDEADHFIGVYHFDVVSHAPMKPLFDAYDFDDGKNMLMKLGGTNLN